MSVFSLQGSGLIGQWLIGCQSFIFIAMAEYGYILFTMKFKTDNVITDYLQEKVSTLELTQKIRKLDAFFVILMPVLFLIFNIVFWTRISYLTHG